jgi:hypothetical protein
MAITITKAEVKRKCAIPSGDTTYDSDIDSLISEMQPAVEYTIAESYLNDTGNTKLQSALKLGILEIISGEFLDQLCRELGASEEFKVGGVTIGERKERGQALIMQGAARLAPFLKSMQTAPADQPSASPVQSTTGDDDRAFGLSEPVW